MEEPVTIVDREVLKVLAVDTRMDILKQLSFGGRTPSDLGKKLKKSDATIVEHLDVLCKAGLVKKVEQPGKKWVFYTLTERGKGIISSKSRRLVIILATSFLALFGGFTSFLKYSIQSNYFTAMKAPALEAGAEAGTVATQTPVFLYLSVALFAFSIAGFIFYIWKKSKIKGEGI
jgi:DNA-binding transcriptional ArsR family regulator